MQKSPSNGQPDRRPIWKIGYLLGDVAGGSDEFVERLRPKVISTVLAAENARDFETVLSPWRKGSQPLKSLIDQITHSPVTQEFLVLRQPLQLMSIACHDFTVKIFWT
jgi:hypothetical protein